MSALVDFSQPSFWSEFAPEFKLKLQLRNEQQS